MPVKWKITCRRGTSSRDAHGRPARAHQTLTFEFRVGETWNGYGALTYAVRDGRPELVYNHLPRDAQARVLLEEAARKGLFDRRGARAGVWGARRGRDPADWGPGSLRDLLRAEEEGYDAPHP